MARLLLWCCCARWDTLTHPASLSRSPGDSDHRKEATSTSYWAPRLEPGLVPEELWMVWPSRSLTAEVRSWTELVEMASVSSLVMAFRNGREESLEYYNMYNFLRISRQACRYCEI